MKKYGLNSMSTFCKLVKLAERMTPDLCRYAVDISWTGIASEQIYSHRTIFYPSFLVLTLPDLLFTTSIKYPPIQKIFLYIFKNNIKKYTILIEILSNSQF